VLRARCKSLGRRYVRHVNAAERRTGTLWEGRYRAAAIDGEAHFISCMRYIELNPVRAGMVAHPRAYRWSSFAANAEGAADPLLREHALYRTLGATPAVRRREYRALFRAALDPAFVDALRRSILRVRYFRVVAE
jgi:putative transposase